jgi:N utilization substance protein A
MVVSELRGEKIDIIPYNEEPARFVAKALSPARVREVLVDDEKEEATVIVPDDQLSLAIGREGQNARLAAKLTGWKVDIKSETEFSQEEDELAFEEAEEADGRCAAVLSAGRRCPNAALPGSRYCGIPQHQALGRFETNQVTVLSALTDQEVQQLADSGTPEGEIGPLVERATAEFDQAEAEAGAETEAVAEPEVAEEPEAAGEPEAADEPDPQGSVDQVPKEEALAEDAAAEGPQDEAPAEEAPVGVKSSEESEPGGEDSEEPDSEQS